MSERPLARVVWWSLAGAWTFVVVFVCLLRGTWVSAWIKEIMGFSTRLGLRKGVINDHVLHGGSFLVLGLLYATALGEGSWRRVRRPALARTGAALLGLGALLEGLQYFVPGRTCDWADLSANTLGVLVGLLPAAWIAWRQPPTPAPAPEASHATT